MGLGTIPTENVVLASAVLTGYIAYQTRVNGLETGRERERYLNEALEEATTLSDTWGITIDNIAVYENSGALYRLWKFITGRISGEADVTVRYERATIPSEFWESGAGKPLLNGYRVDVEHIDTQDHVEPTLAAFRFGSLDEEDIAGFFGLFLEYEKEMRPDSRTSPREQQ